MTYAIIQAGASQHKVSQGERLKIDLISGKKKGDKIIFDKVLLTAASDQYKIGAPFVSGAKVEAAVVDNGEDNDGVKGKKVWSLKRRPGDYIKHKGHRQRHTVIKIESITP